MISKEKKALWEHRKYKGKFSPFFKEKHEAAAGGMAKNIEERSDGRIEIDVFGGAVLGTNKEVYEQVKNGAMVMTIADAGYLSDYYPDIGVLNGPYLLADVNDFDKILKSEWYAETLSNLTDASDLKVTAFNWLFGARHIITNKEVRHPNDMKDVAIRVPPNVMWVETFKSMGAKGTQVAWAEVYGALSTGLVDAAEAQLPKLSGPNVMSRKKVYERLVTSKLLLLR